MQIVKKFSGGGKNSIIQSRLAALAALVLLLLQIAPPVRAEILQPSDSTLMPLSDTKWPVYVAVTDTPDYRSACPVFIYKRSKCVLNPTKEMDGIGDVLRRIMADERLGLSYVWAVGSTSPEGPEDFNVYLGKQRTSQIVKWLTKTAGVPDSLIRTKSIPENWEYLVERLDERPDYPQRENILRIISEDPDFHRRKQKIKALDGGRTWRKMDRELYPAFRTSGILIVCQRRLPNLQPVEAVSVPVSETAAPPMPEIGELPEITVSQMRDHRVVLVKTNALVAATTLVANLGVEIELAHHWSVDIPVYYSPYNMFRETRKVRVLGMQPEVRYWFDRVAGGHFVGLHTHVTSAFNVAINDHGRYQDPHYPLWGMGLSYGYAMPLGKSSHWGVEFTGGLGFATYKFNIYENIGPKDGPLVGHGKERYWGVTRAAVSFSYKFSFTRRHKNQKNR